MSSEAGGSPIELDGFDRTDHGHELPALCRWHVADLAMEHVYIQLRTLQPNGRIERSHRTD